MNLPAHKQSKTVLQTSKRVKVSDFIPEELRNECKNRTEALATTHALIVDRLQDVPELRGINLSRSEISMQSGDVIADVSYSVSVDGFYTKPSTIGRDIDPSTLNLLINSKVLTLDEKRTLLKARGLLPDTQGE